MGKEIIINAEKEQTRIAIVENGELAELYYETSENERTLGDIYLGKVKKIMPSIQAAFVDIGQKQDAFLHFSDLSDNLEEMLQFLDDDHPEVGKVVSRNASRPSLPPAPSEEESSEESDGGHRHADVQERSRRRSAQRRLARPGETLGEPAEIDEDDDDIPAREPRRTPPEFSLKRDQRILVKIVKEPISTKGSRVSTDISLAGRFLVLVPLADYVAVSKKIVSYKERRRLRALAKSLLPEGFGIIVRTVAENKNAKALDTDLRLLVDKWRKIERKLENRPEPPVAVHEDVNMASSVIRDLFSDDYDRILIDDLRVYRNVKNYIQAVAPQMVPAVQQHRDGKPIFEAVGLAKDVAGVFESRVDLPGGGYLFIERTEAMYVIDVNSGRSGKGMTQEDNSVKVNLEAARVIAHQVRLRDIGGIIVVDFIDLRDERNRQKISDELRKEFRKDRAVTKVLPMSDFGLIQITRQRLRPSITTWAGPRAASAAGASAAAEPVRHVDEVMHDIEAFIQYAKNEGNKRSLHLNVHPVTAAYLRSEFPRATTRWLFKYFVWVKVRPDPKIAPLAFRFYDPEDGSDITERRFVKPVVQKERKPEQKTETAPSSAQGGGRQQPETHQQRQGQQRQGQQRRPQQQQRGGRSEQQRPSGQQRPGGQQARPGEGQRETPRGGQAEAQRNRQQQGGSDARSRQQPPRPGQRSAPQGRVDRPEGPDRPHREERDVRRVQPERDERRVQPERTERDERRVQAERTERDERRVHPERTERDERRVQAERTERDERRVQAERTERDERRVQPESTERERNRVEATTPGAPGLTPGGDNSEWLSTYEPSEPRTEAPLPLSEAPEEARTESEDLIPEDRGAAERSETGAQEEGKPASRGRRSPVRGRQPALRGKGRGSRSEKADEKPATETGEIGPSAPRSEEPVSGVGARASEQPTAQESRREPQARASEQAPAQESRREPQARASEQAPAQESRREPQARASEQPSAQESKREPDVRTEEKAPAEKRPATPPTTRPNARIAFQSAHREPPRPEPKDGGTASGGGERG